jgi:hypothetical protein
MISQTGLHIEDRLAAMERRSRRATLLVLVLLSAALIAWVGGPQSAPEALTAQAFQLVDAEGNVWAELALRENGPALVLFDGEGVTRASLIHSDDESALYLRDEKGDIRVGAAQFAHGGGGFALHGPGGDGAAVLYLKGDGSLTFYDVNGEATARVPAK